MKYDVHGKKLPVPSFFQVYNYGGGNGDKDREIVYADFSEDTPALINYYYINNKYPHLFQSKLFDNIDDFDKPGDLYNYIRKELIKKGELYSAHQPGSYDFNRKIFLLDSGAAHIVKQIASETNYDKNKLQNALVNHLHDYYDFADKLNFDIVVGFDLGGKYTEKDDENDVRQKKFLRTLDTDEINNFLLEETVKYLSTKKNYFPYVLATVHGKTPTDYEACVQHILSLEEKYNYHFWGFALGGLASYKNLDQKWLAGINFNGIGKRDFAPLVGPARASQIVRKLAGDRPIHALGCGGYYNIPTNYFCGATSFDAASPNRRVCDGSEKSAKLVHNKRHYKKSEAAFSKYFIGGFNADGTLRNGTPKYINLNEVDDSLKMCGCPACQEAKTILNIKNLYAKKATGDDEASYYARQLMGMHAVYQHTKLCEIVSGFSTIDEFCKKYPNDLTNGISKIYKQL